MVLRAIPEGHRPPTMDPLGAPTLQIIQEEDGAKAKGPSLSWPALTTMSPDSLEEALAEAKELGAPYSTAPPVVYWPNTMSGESLEDALAEAKQLPAAEEALESGDDDDEDEDEAEIRNASSRAALRKKFSWPDTMSEQTLEEALAEAKRGGPLYKVSQVAASPTSPPPPPQSPPPEALKAMQPGPPPPPRSPVGRATISVEEALAKEAVDPQLQSVGSALHATGQCCPCAWFYKAQGCQNGANCTRCHLCPPGEVKARKKAAKDASSRREQARKEMEEPIYVNVNRFGMGVPSMGGRSPYATEGVPQKNTFIHYSDPGPPSGPPVYSAPSVLSRQEPQRPESVAASNDAGSAMGESPGSAPEDPKTAHLRGQCKPCSYFWYKEDGCRNKDDCAFCHICEKGESKKRKKERIRTLKATGQFQQAR